MKGWQHEIQKQIKALFVNRVVAVAGIIIVSGVTTVFNYIIFSVRDSSTYSQRILALEQHVIDVDKVVNTLNQDSEKSSLAIEQIRKDISSIQTDIRSLVTALINK